MGTIATDVSQVEYACIMKVCIYRRAESTGNTIYVCMHACMHVLCMYVCMYAIRRAIRISLFGALIGALGGMDVSQVEYACIMNVCIAYIDALEVLYMYYTCMYYVCMYVCMYVCYSVHYSAPIGAPIRA